LEINGTIVSRKKTLAMEMLVDWFSRL